MSKQGTIHLTYWREYEDSEERYDPYFKIHHTDDTIGLYDNDMNLIKTIRGVI